MPERASGRSLLDGYADESFLRRLENRTSSRVRYSIHHGNYQIKKNPSVVID